MDIGQSAAISLPFQLTRPARGATYSAANRTPPTRYFNSHAPRGARRYVHANRIFANPFQLTRPARGATLYKPARISAINISTHTPREGRDVPLDVNRLYVKCYFNSHAPRGARRGLTSRLSGISIFQLTRPARGATKNSKYCNKPLDISTHTPREGRDVRNAQKNV